MSRADYYDLEDDYWSFIKWRGQLMSAIRGKRGQAFLRELLAALEAMPQKRLISNHLRTIDGEVCALGALGRARGMDLEVLDPDEYFGLADAFNVAQQIVRELEYQNDEICENCSGEDRWRRVRDWAEKHLEAVKP